MVDLDQLDSVLSCAALAGGLEAVLLLDADGADLGVVADRLAELIAEATARDVATARVDSWLDEDELWVHPELAPGTDGFVVRERVGPLAATSRDGPVPLVLIPDLARISPADARGLVTVVGADVAHLERHGTSRRWRPDAWWLAACERSAVSRVSPHLLDRFALRIDCRRATATATRRDDLRRWVDAASEPARATVPEGLRRAAATAPALTPEALDRVLDYFPQPAPRRELALARLAGAWARLKQRSADASTVDLAAEALGLRLPEAETRPGMRRTGTRPEVDEIAAGSGAGNTAATEQPDSTVYGAGDAAVLPAGELGEDAATPYPEDETLAGHEFTPLREGAAGARRQTLPRGTVVGVKRTQTAHDLAVLATILTAARWQPYRRARDPSADGRMRLLPSDLRSYRRAPETDRLLVLVLDMTCLADWPWGDLVFPYFRWAYVERAQVCLIRVGADDARVDTRADRIIARSLLDPRLDTALSAGAGRATPLAHGLQLALDTLRHKRHHGQGIVREARLVVATDGRGNVPLQLDADLRVRDAVHSLGIDDALAVARAIGALPRVERVLLDPEPDLHPELVQRLGEALGAQILRAAEAEVAA